jgi:cytochrome b
MAAEPEKPANYRGQDLHQVVVWDPLVRICHWLLVFFFFVAYFTEDDLLTIHSWAGYGVGIYIIVRVIWGFIGPRHARFADFAYGPRKAALYMKDLMMFQARRYLGHSPAGGLMVFLLLFALTATTVTGIALLAVEENAGPLAPWLGHEAGLEKSMLAHGPLAAPALASEDEDENHENEYENNDEEKGEALEEIHEFFSNLTLLLVIMHIVGVALASIVHKENLVRAMVTGRKRSQ